ncbi:cation diffusion facilitator family transporter [Anaerosacchariphilus polymeriproducens]|uniref:Cation transporter n=1 Tax=Anaerosacchariphilus polymeriproducens TaxID=1812858 RepID=A0A371AVY4_9FIRM|nr:cation diffusion facilitator family transporter [Anaerosacchariphilus polymeriproducens]RDU23754.1 cation transporter [Anaerosacchariphilus polymeriproducens]
MTSLLVKLFIKNEKNVDDVKVRTAYGVLASIVGILCNVFLFACKLAVGMLLNSIAVIADAFNNLSDAASAVISFIGIKMAEKPADEKHPFGHGRMEYIAAFVVAFLVLQVGFSFFKDSFDKIRHPQQIVFQISSIIILVVSVIIKLWLGLFYRKLGKRINSNVLQATSTDAFGDAIITSVTIVAILVGYLTGLAIDGYAGILVSLVVIWAGIGIARETLEPLIGQAVPPEVYLRITQKVESYEGIVGSHDLIVHNYGPSRNMATIHAEVSKDADIEDSHELVDMIERDVFKELGIFLVIHMDPVEVKDEKILQVREQVQQKVEKIDPKFSIHDFRYVGGTTQINLIFDLVVPRTYQQDQDEEIKHFIEEELQKIDNRFRCKITVERSFIQEKS